MGFIDTSPPMKWGLVKIVSVLLCILIIVGVFLPWAWYETKTAGTTTHYDSTGIDDYSQAYTIIFSALFSLLFIFLSYNININIQDGAKRINELFSGMLALLVFLDSANLARIISKRASETSMSTGSYSTSIGVGSGLWLVVISSFLLMIFSFLLWRQKSQGTVAAATLTSSQVSPPTVPKQVEKRLVTPAPVSLSKEEIITVFSKIPGITTKKALSVYNAGYMSFSDLRSASPDKLLSIKGITLKDVENIKKEIEF